jgi:hypothetical protein
MVRQGDVLPDAPFREEVIQVLPQGVEPLSVRCASGAWDGARQAAR